MECVGSPLLFHRWKIRAVLAKDFHQNNEGEISDSDKKLQNAYFRLVKFMLMCGKSIFEPKETAA